MEPEAGKGPGTRDWGTPGKDMVPVAGKAPGTRDCGKPPVDRHTPVKTVSTHRTAYAGGKRLVNVSY